MKGWVWTTWILLLYLYDSLCFNGTVEISPHNTLKACKHGTFILNDFDSIVSKHMRVYGEWSELELQLFLSIVQPDDIVLDIGANIGAFTVPLAKRVGRYGRVHSFEPQRVIFQRLNANIALNGLENVNTYHAAVGNVSGSIDVPYLEYTVEANFGAFSLAKQYENVTKEWTYSVPMLTLDSIDFFNPFTRRNCPAFIKIDVELMEKSVLQGGTNMVARCKPIIHTENNNELTTAGLVEQLYSMDYVPFWEIQPSFNAAFKGKAEDFSKGHHTVNMISVPREKLSTEGGNVVMINYVQVQRDKPFVRDYFLQRGADGALVPKYHQDKS